MRIIRFVLVSLFASPAALVFACGSDGDGGGQRCDDADQCVTWECVCNSGMSPTVAMCIGRRCADESACDGMCDNAGGLVDVHELPSVKGSPECNAFCQKAASLGCPDDWGCNPYTECAIESGECAESTRARLKCELETGTWKCDSFGNWSVQSYSCPSVPCADGGAEG